MLALAVPLTAVAFLVGPRALVGVHRPVESAARGKLDAHSTPEDLRLALAEAFDDPELTIAYWLGDRDGHWGDARGTGSSPGGRAGRAVTEIATRTPGRGDRPRRRAGGRPRVHRHGDLVCADDAREPAAVGADALAAARGARSRARIQAAADDERRRIERDLHDGAQQRLVALRIKLELAAEQAGDGNGNGAAGAAVLRRLGSDVEEALEEVRSLARGIYPASLADRGLVEGLRAAALRNALPTTVLAAGVRRHSRDIESAAYFCCLEALQNAAKHAVGATAVVIEYGTTRTLRLEVRDDGAGFDPMRSWAGSGSPTCATAWPPSTASSRSAPAPGAAHASPHPSRSPVEQR